MIKTDLIMAMNIVKYIVKFFFLKVMILIYSSDVSWFKGF